METKELLVCQAIYLREAPNGKAFHCILTNDEKEKLKYQWLPHSQVKSLGGTRVNGEYLEEIIIGIPMWLAEKENITSLYKEEMVDKEYGEDDVFDNDDSYEEIDFNK